tara:strand:- start:442 stop:639 length:198 start_codon:yes stop_codon:yes gene_type:complete
MVSLRISYEEEEFGRSEVSEYSRFVGDLDPHDWLWYLLKATETAGYDAERLSMESTNGKTYRTDL